MWNYQQFGTNVQLRLFSHLYETLPSHETNRIGMAHLVDWVGESLLQLRTALVNAREFQNKSKYQYDLRKLQYTQPSEEQ